MTCYNPGMKTSIISAEECRRIATEYNASLPQHPKAAMMVEGLMPEIRKAATSGQLSASHRVRETDIANCYGISCDRKERQRYDSELEEAKSALSEWLKSHGYAVELHSYEDRDSDGAYADFVEVQASWAHA